MKKITGLLLCLLAAALCAFALADAKIETTFTDDVFRAYVSSEFDTDGNGILSDEEIASVTTIDVSELGISQLQGVEIFTALEGLYCSSNRLSELDVSRNTRLTDLDCSRNQLTGLDVSKNTELDYLYCYQNKLTSLIPGSSLYELYCGQNRLTHLDLSKCAALTRMDCTGNQIRLLDVSSCETLSWMVQNETRTTAEEDGVTYDFWYFGGSSDFLNVDRFTAVRAGNTYSEPTVRPDPVPVAEMKLNRTRVTLARTSKKEKPTVQLKVTVLPENADDRTVEWKSSNPKVATVSAKGKVTALKKGTATITCTARDGSGVKVSCRITVKDRLVSKISLNKTKVSIGKGKTFQLTVKKITPTTAFNRKVKWSSSDQKIATVDKNGKVKARKKGTCYIICTAADGSGVKIKCRITVK